MTEAQWLTCADLTLMLIQLRGEVEPAEKEPDTRPRLITRHGPLVYGHAKNVSEQRLGRFACECCRKWWELPIDEMSRHLVVNYERFLIGDGSWQEFASACSQVWKAIETGARPLINAMCQWSLTPFGMASLTRDLAWVTACHVHREQIEGLERSASEDQRFEWHFGGYDFPEFGATVSEVSHPFPAVLREVVGNPFRPVALDPSLLVWNDATIPELAVAINDQRAFDRMPVLADALEVAGCTNAAILDHCRSEGPHFRGCWVLDLLLGKV